MTVQLWKEGDSSPLRTVDISSGVADSNGFVYSNLSSGYTVSLGEHLAIQVIGYSSNKIGDSSGFSDPSPSFDGSLTSALVTTLGVDGVANPYTFTSTFPSNNRYTFASFTTTPVPEPEVYASIAGLALVGYGLFRRQVRK